MAKASAGKSAQRGAEASAGHAPKGRVSRERVEAVLQAAEQSGFLSEKSGRIAGRVSEALVKQAKRQTGIGSDTELIEFALATIALERQVCQKIQGVPRQGR